MHKPKNPVLDRFLKRRAALQAGLGACASLLLGRTHAQSNSLVTAGDVLVYASGDKADQPILVNLVGLNKALRVLLDFAPRGVKEEGLLCDPTASAPFTILTQKPFRLGG